MMLGQMLVDGVFYGGVCDGQTPKDEVLAPYDGARIGSVAVGGISHARAALDAAESAFASYSKTPRRERQVLLRAIAERCEASSEDLAKLMAQEVGKPITWARAEVSRLVLTFRLAADLLSEPSGQVETVDYDPRGDGYHCRLERFPIGPILAIVPWNWPFNLAAHKIAPALAAGNTVVLKPSRAAALSTLELARLVHEAGAPPGVLNAINVSGQIAEQIAQDPRLAMVSFTGSPEVGWRLKKLASDRKVELELGGNAFVVVCNDADLDWAVKRIVSGAYGYAGQVCISVQHVLAEPDVYEEIRERLIAATNEIPWGDPLDESTVCGPVVDSDAAERIESWVTEALEAGGKLLAGGSRVGLVLEPTLVEDCPPETRLAREEVFGPVATLEKVADFDEAISKINASSYGLQAGVFTHDLRIAERAFRELEVGGVVVNDAPTLRFDSMAYGGVKRSGFGREGVRYAFEQMTEPRTLLMRTI